MCFNFIFLFKVYSSKSFFLVVVSKSLIACVKQKITTGYDHDQVGGLLAFDGAVQSFQAHEVIYPNQLMNARPENVPQIEHMPLYGNNLCSFQPHTDVNFYSSILFSSFLTDLCSISLYHHRPQSMRPLNESSTNNQIAKNITSNNFSSISQQQSLCPTLFPQNPVDYYYLILKIFVLHQCLLY